MVVARIEKYNGYPAFVIDGVVYPPMTATIRSRMLGEFQLDKEYIRQLRKVGIRIFFLICDTEWLTSGAIEQFRRRQLLLLT